MRFLANENFPGAAVLALTAAGHDVIRVASAMRGASDTEVLACAARESRILLTFDKDFGELAGASRLPMDCGVVLFRFLSRELLRLESDWPACLAHVMIGPATFL
jgi:predicted nuclease of predicted toxin-antitoxin system